MAPVKCGRCGEAASVQHTATLCPGTRWVWRTAARAAIMIIKLTVDKLPAASVTTACPADHGIEKDGWLLTCSQVLALHSEVDATNEDSMAAAIKAITDTARSGAACCQAAPVQCCKSDGQVCTWQLGITTYLAPMPSLRRIQHQTLSAGGTLVAGTSYDKHLLQPSRTGSTRSSTRAAQSLLSASW